MKKFLNKKMFIILLMGFSSGLPYALTSTTLQAWMRSSGVDLGTIGLFAFVGLPYTLKFLWAPLIDRYKLFKLGRRKSWMLVTQALLIITVVFLGFTDPTQNLWLVAFWSLLVAFFSASQDITVDAWRRESLKDDELGLGSSVHVGSYLFAFRMVSGAAALILSDHFPWSVVYLMMAASLGLGIIATFMAEEPKVESQPRTLKAAVVEPFVDFFNHKGAVSILVFIMLYKVGDNMASQMSLPFYIDLGFTRTEVGAVTKVLGWVSLAIGGLVGGALLTRFKMATCLIYFGILQAISTAGFAYLEYAGKNLTVLSGVISFENFTTGMGTSAFVAFMASLTNKKFTATQYALLTSFMGVPRTFMAAPTGYMAQAMGWSWFFIFCTLVAIPGIFMIPYMNKKR